MQTFTLKLTGEELELIGRMLPDHPYKFVAPILDKINRQIQEQLQGDVQDASNGTNS